MIGYNLVFKFLVDPWIEVPLIYILELQLSWEQCSSIRDYKNQNRPFQ